LESINSKKKKAGGTKKEIQEKKISERNKLTDSLFHYKQLQLYPRNALHFTEGGSSP